LRALPVAFVVNAAQATLYEHVSGVPAPRADPALVLQRSRGVRVAGATMEMLEHNRVVARRC